MAVYPSSNQVTPQDIEILRHEFDRQNQTLAAIQKTLREILSAQQKIATTFETTALILNRLTEHNTGVDPLLLKALVDMDNDPIK